MGISSITQLKLCLYIFCSSKLSYYFGILRICFEVQFYEYKEYSLLLKNWFMKCLLLGPEVRGTRPVLVTFETFKVKSSQVVTYGKTFSCHYWQIQSLKSNSVIILKLDTCDFFS